MWHPRLAEKVLHAKRELAKAQKKKRYVQLSKCDEPRMTPASALYSMPGLAALPCIIACHMGEEAGEPRARGKLEEEYEPLAQASEAQELRAHISVVLSQCRIPRSKWTRSRYTILAHCTNCFSQYSGTGCKERRAQPSHFDMCLGFQTLS